MSSILRLSPLEAFAALGAQSGAILLDVRDPIEFGFVGHPEGAVNIPWKFAPDMRPNPDFLRQIGRLAPELDTPLFVLCRSGQRSLDAAQSLAAAGYRTLVNIEEGFEGPLDANKHRSTLGGWRFHGLPWKQG
jgi:rhodanese-related sulfurtransferase